MFTVYDQCATVARCHTHELHKFNRIVAECAHCMRSTSTWFRMGNGKMANPKKKKNEKMMEMTKRKIMFLTKSRDAMDEWELRAVFTAFLRWNLHAAPCICTTKKRLRELIILHAVCNFSILVVYGRKRCWSKADFFLYITGSDENNLNTSGSLH